MKSEIASLNDGNITSACFPQTLALLSKEYPQLNEQQMLSIIELVCNALLEKQKERIRLVATIPPSFSLKTKRIQNIIEELIKNAQKSILLTGYSISGFISELLDLLIDKSQKGVLVKFFLNDATNQLSVEKLLRYKSRFLQIYDYKNKEDKMAALHAKIIMVDNKDIMISSANLSYHGMSGNIEIGTHIESSKIAKQIEELFKDLLFSNIFTTI